VQLKEGYLSLFSYQFNMVLTIDRHTGNQGCGGDTPDENRRFFLLDVGRKIHQPLHQKVSIIKFKQ
jgi:hypothetical protein